MTWLDEEDAIRRWAGEKDILYEIKADMRRMPDPEEFMTFDRRTIGPRGGDDRFRAAAKAGRKANKQRRGR